MDDPGTVTNEQLLEALSHQSAQLDVLNQNIHTTNQYLSAIVVSIMLITALVMFLVGRKVGGGG